MTTANIVSAPVAAACPRKMSNALAPRNRATARLGRERSSRVRNVKTSLRRRAVTRTKSFVADVEDKGLSEEEEEERRLFFAAATGLFAPVVLSSSSRKHGPCCLLPTSFDVNASKDAFNLNGGGGGGGGRNALGNGILALALGVAGFGTMGGGRSLSMEQAAHAAVVNVSSGHSSCCTSASASLSSSDSSSRTLYSKYSNSLLPAAVTTSGAARTHPDHIGFVPNPHFEDMICSRWFVGSMNALG